MYNRYSRRMSPNHPMFRSFPCMARETTYYKDGKVQRPNFSRVLCTVSNNIRSRPPSYQNSSMNYISLLPIQQSSRPKPFPPKLKLHMDQSAVDKCQLALYNTHSKVSTYCDCPSTPCVPVHTRARHAKAAQR